MRYTKICAIIILLLTIVLLTGCASSPESVKLANKSSILTYAKHEYGEAEFVSKKDGENRVEYILKDKQYGFTYEIVSFAQSVGMDGSTFWYSEEKSSNFDTQYQQYILSEIKPYIDKKTEEINVDLKTSISPDLFFAEIQLKTESNISTAITFLKELGQKILEIDDRKYFTSSEISLVNQNRYDKIGSFDFSDGKYKSLEEEHIEYYTDRMSQIMKINKKELQYLYKKEMLVQDVPGLSNESIVHVLGTDMENIECYHFNYDNKEYFIASINVYDKNNSIHQYIYCINERKSMTGRIEGS